MYKKGTGNDKQGKDAGNRTLCPYRNFSQAIIHYIPSFTRAMSKLMVKLKVASILHHDSCSGVTKEIFSFTKCLSLVMGPCTIPCTIPCTAFSVSIRLERKRISGWWLFTFQGMLFNLMYINQVIWCKFTNL